MGVVSMQAAGGLDEQELSSRTRWSGADAGSHLTRQAKLDEKRIDVGDSSQGVCRTMKALAQP